MSDAIRSLRPLRPVLLAVLTLSLSGCAWLSSVNPFGGKDDGTGPAPLIDFKPEGSIHREWSVSIGNGLGKRYTRLVPAVVGDVVYAADAYGDVEARSLSTGKRIWQARVGTPGGGFLSSLVFWGRDDDGGSFVSGGVAADDLTVFVGTEDGVLIALRASDGGELWRATLSSEILSPPAMDADKVFVATLDGRLTALSRSDGSRLWSYDTQVPVLTLRGTGHPVVSDPLVFIGFANGRVAALRAADGSTVWEHVVALPTGRSELDRMADVDAAPLIQPSGAYVASYQGALKSLRLQDGNVQWEHPISTYDALAEGYGQIYVTTADGSLVAVGEGNGNVVWQQDGLARRGVTGPAVFGPWIAVGDAEGYVHLFAQSDGRPVARVKVDGRGLRSAPIGLDDGFLVQGDSGRLARYSFDQASPNP